MSESLLIPCPHCTALNRVPAERLHDGGTCGRCKKGLFASAPVNLTEGNFAAHAERSDIPLLVDSWATWCGPKPQHGASLRCGGAATGASNENG